MAAVSHLMNNAIQSGDINKVKELVRSRGLNYVPGWCGGYWLVCKAILEKKVAIANYLIRQGAKLQINGNKNPGTPLHIAAFKGCLRIVRTLLNKGVDIDFQDWREQSPIHIALKQGNHAIAGLLLERGASADLIDDLGRAPIHIACRYAYHDTRKYEKLILRLLNNTANLEAKTSLGDTPLHLTVPSRCLEIIKLLLDRGANVNAVNKNQETPLHIAIHRSDKKSRVKRWSIFRDQDLVDRIGEKDINALSDYLDGPIEKVIKLLVEHKADVNARDKYNRSPLSQAISYREAETLRLLLKGANPDDIHGILIEAVKKSWTNGCKIIFEYGFKDVNLRDKSGRTPLSYAVLGVVAELLLHNGADPEVKSDDGFTALQQASSLGNLGVVRVLLDNGARSDSVTETNGETALHLSIKRGYVEVVKALLKHGLDVNTEDYYDNTPLHLAVICGNHNIVRILLEEGADANIKTDEGKTPLHLAVRSNSCDIVKTLLEEGADVNIETNEGKTPLDLKSTRFEGFGLVHPAARIIKFHIIKLKTAGLYVSEKNLAAIRYFHHDFELDCKKELTKLPKLDRYMSTYDILSTKNPRYVLNETLGQDLESINYEEFPLYGKLLRRKFNDDRKRLPLLQISTESFNLFTQKAFKIKLPDELALKILCYMENFELENWIDCCHDLGIIQVPNRISHKQ